MEKVIKILEESVKKHGSIPLTTKHLLNILRMAKESSEKEADFAELESARYEIY